MDIWVRIRSEELERRLEGRCFVVKPVADQARLYSRALSLATVTLHTLPLPLCVGGCVFVCVCVCVCVNKTDPFFGSSLDHCKTALLNYVGFKEMHNRPL